MTSSFRVMVVDDDRVGRVTTVKALRKVGYDAVAVDNPFLALKRAQEEVWHVVLTDLRMPGMDGLEFLRRIKDEHPEIEVILMTAFGSVETAVEAMQAGAVDYLVKPFRMEELGHRLAKLRELRRVRTELESLRKLLDVGAATFGLVGRSPAMSEVFERIQIFAKHDAPVLVTGETGTGKELVARALHQCGRRSDGPFVAIACGTIPSELAESELFGHEKGAFTGAHRRRQGSFGRAHGGTLLLDDVDDLPLHLQVKLLRVLQEGTMVRVGGVEEVTIDVRVVATSKADLFDAVEAGDFRDDLFYRLRGLEILLPPLRERGEDVLLLAQHFLRVIAAMEGQEPTKLSVEAADILRGYSWPGNVRELRRAIESAIILSRDDQILPEHLPAFLLRRRPENHRSDELFELHIEGSGPIAFTEVVQRFEHALITWALSKSDGHQTTAADLLGLPRTTLQSKIKRPDVPG